MKTPFQYELDKPAPLAHLNYVADDGSDGGETPKDAPAADPKPKEAPAADPAPKDPPAADPKPKEEPPADNSLDDSAKALLREVMEKKARIKDLESKGVQQDEKRIALEKELQEFREAKQAAELKALEESNDFEGVKQRMAEQHKQEMANAVTEATQTLQEKIDNLEQMTSDYEGNIAQLLRGSSFKQSKYIAEETVLPAAHAERTYEDFFDVEGIEIVGYNKPRGEKERTPLVDGQGKPLKFEEAIAEIVKADPDYNNIARSKLKPGAQSNTASASSDALDDNNGSDSVRGLSRIEASLAAQKSA